MNLALIDDIPMETERLKTLLKHYASTHGLIFDVDCFSGAEDFLAEYHPFQYTIIFMDIYMNGMSGVDAAGIIRSLDSDVFLIFLTGSGDHMSDAFRCHAYDYIQKPADPDRLFKVLDDITKKLHPTNTLAFSSERTTYSIPFDDIIYVHAANHHLEITDTAGITYKTRTKFSTINDVLSKDGRFLLVLRGVLVNMDYVQDFNDGCCHLDSDICLPINIRNSKKLEQIWKNYKLHKSQSNT